MISAISKSENSSQKLTHLPKCPNINTLYEIIKDHSSPSEDKVRNNKHKQLDPDMDSIASFRTVHSNLDLIGHLTK